MAIAYYLAFLNNQINAVIWLFFLHTGVMTFWLGKLAGSLSYYSDPDKYHQVRALPFLTPYLALIGLVNLILSLTPYVPQDKNIIAGFQIVGYWVMIPAYFFFVKFSLLLCDSAKMLETERADASDDEKEFTLRLVAEIGQDMLSAKQMIDVLSRITEAAREATGAKASALWIYDDRKELYVNTCVSGNYPPVRGMRSGAAAASSRALQQKTRIEKFKPDDGTYIGEILKTGQPIIINDVIRHSHPLIKQAEDSIIEINAIIAVPIITAERTLGVISVINKDETIQWFSKADRSAIETLARQVVLSKNHFDLYKSDVLKKLQERDVEVAAEVQKNLLPQEFFNTDVFEYHAVSKAAKGVGGDYFDFVQIDENRYGMIMCDVAGKGIAASLVMVILSAVFKQIVQEVRDTRRVIELLNVALFKNTAEGSYSTALFFIYDRSTRKIIFSNAAHAPLLIYRSASGSFEEADTGGMPLGVTQDTQYEQSEIQMCEGDIVSLYTDGISEAMNSSRDQYGLERLKEMIKQNAAAPCADIIGLVSKDIADFAGDAPQHDDMTLLLARLK